MSSVYLLLQKIRQCPQLYLGKLSLERLHAFLDGYQIGRLYEVDNCLEGFNEYVAMHYHISSSQNWSSIIQFFHLSDEEAFWEFFKLFDQFMDAKRKRENPKVKYIDYDTFLQLSKEKDDQFYLDRWRYFNSIIDLVQQAKPQSVLEIDPELFTVVANADIMHQLRKDYVPFSIHTNACKCYDFDAAKPPWPIVDKQYDLVIALRLFERLSGNQADVFREMARIARNVIVSVPCDWGRGELRRDIWPPEDIHSDLIGIASWQSQIDITNTGEPGADGQRVIRLWSFEQCL